MQTRLRGDGNRENTSFDHGGAEVCSVMTGMRRGLGIDCSLSLPVEQLSDIKETVKRQAQNEQKEFFHTWCSKPPCLRMWKLKVCLDSQESLIGSWRTNYLC